MSLSHLAYADGLTHLANRAKSDKLMDELNNAKDDYCILSIDLNGLKIVNDKYGHPTGDKYIKDFSKVLMNTFGDESFCARIGGDEFLVVIRDAGGKDINHELESGGSHEVYLLADQRMYEMKRKMHEELGIHARL